MKLLMCQGMTQYAWQKAFEHVQEEGPQRIVQFFKIALAEMPRLEAQISNYDEQKKARDEAVALFHQIDLEMHKVMQSSKLSPEEFVKEFKRNKNFTPEEWGQLSRVPELIGKHRLELFASQAFKTPKKRSPYFKV